MGVFAGSVAAATGLAILNRSRSLGANIAASAGSDLALAAAGVRLNVVGEENIWAARPAVFLFNHQSQLDVFVLAALLRKDFTGVAKKSLEKDPFFGPIGYLADVAYIDRSNNAAAREGLEPAVEALRNGRSIAIAPEGTRSPTPRLLPFKKGPFHLAMQALILLLATIQCRLGIMQLALQRRQVRVLSFGDSKGFLKNNGSVFGHHKVFRALNQIRGPVILVAWVLRDL